MGLFGPSLPKRVTREEFKQIMNNLYGKLDENERANVEMLFRADLEESGTQSGITKAEFDSAMKWLQDNKRKYVLEDNDLKVIDKYFLQHLQD